MENIQNLILNFHLEDILFHNVRLKNLNRIKIGGNNVLDEVINESIDFILIHFDEESINDEISPISLKDFVSKYFERLRSINIIGVIYDNDDR